MSLTKTTLVVCTKKKMIQRLRKDSTAFVIRVREDGQIPFRVVKEMHRSNPWASDWLKRYDDKGIEGLQDRTKSGRPPELTEEISYQIKQELKESNQGWTTKQIEELIVKKSGIKYHYTHIYPV
jgi:transposase